MTKLFKLFIVVIFCWQAQNIYADTLQPKSRFVDDNIEILSKFIANNDDYLPQKVDTIIIFGSNDTKVVERAFWEFLKMYRIGKKPTIVFTGGIAQDTLLLYKSDYVKSRTDAGIAFLDNIETHKRLFRGDVKTLQEYSHRLLTGKKIIEKYLSEAEIFADMFLDFCEKHDINKEEFSIIDDHNDFDFKKINIIIENQSISTSDNMYKTSILLARYNYHIEKHVLLIQKPIAQLRANLAALKYLGIRTIFINSSVEYIFSIKNIIIEMNKIFSLMRKSIICRVRFPKIIYHSYNILCAA
jgi:hypothetical protein